MITKIKVISVATGMLALAGTCLATFSEPADASGVIATLIGDIGTTLSTSIPVVLGIAGALFGVYLLIRFARRTIK